jgi:ribosomal protein RSM22 (predicted rRNA methylase)
LRQAIDDALAGIPVAALSEAARALSQRYRAELRDGRAHLDSDLAARAYLAVRMPATYAAIRATFESVSEMAPDFAPFSQFDAGAGPGTAFFAASDCWPGLQAATLAERSRPMQTLGERLAEHAAGKTVRWVAADLAQAVPDGARFDLVTAAYVLNELPPDALPRLLGRLWAATGGVLAIVEPGTPAGWARILALREQLIALGAHILAPCPHALKCPLQAPDWCHFARRVARSRLHRLAKDADVPWEDEKYIYLAVSRQPVAAPAARVLAPPRRASGRAELKLCQPDGTAAWRLLSRRDGDDFRVARRLLWGDIWSAR